MFFKKLENGIPIGNLILEENLKYILDLNFDGVITVEEYAEQGYAVFQRTDPPALNYDEEYVEGTPILNNDGTYTQVWTVNKLPDNVAKEKFAARSKEVKDWQKHLLDVYATQLADPNEDEEGIAEINRWIVATKAVDLSDPFNVVWPTEESVNGS